MDGVGGFNMHTIAIQVPIDQLTRDGRLPRADRPDGGDRHLGEREPPQTLRIGRATDGDETRATLVQVSRLGNPLINEVVIPLGQKDRWNMSDPMDDARFLAQIHRARGHAARERPVPGAR